MLCPVHASAEAMAGVSSSVMPEMDKWFLLNQERSYSLRPRLRLTVQNRKIIFSKEIFFIVFFNLNTYVIPNCRSTEITANHASIAQLFGFLQSHSGRAICFGGSFLLHFGNLKLSSSQKISIIFCHHRIFQVHNLSTFDIQEPFVLYRVNLVQNCINRKTIQTININHALLFVIKCCLHNYSMFCQLRTGNANTFLILIHCSHFAMIKQFFEWFQGLFHNLMWNFR